MRIVHIAAESPYNNYWGYQDNLLPKYQAKLGHTVSIITTNQTHKEGKIVETECADYYLHDGVRVIRRKYKTIINQKISKVLAYIPIMDLLNELKPEFVFFHGLSNLTIQDVIRYQKRNGCAIVQDNHLDSNIGYQDTIKHRILRSFYRRLNKRTIKFVNCVYGVTPWRKQYAEDVFGIPSDKTDVLIMGADDDKIDFSQRDIIRHRIRADLNIPENDFLIITGGKIDKSKRTDVLIQACKESGVRLLIFGNIQDDVKDSMDKLLQENPNVTFVGWLAAEKVYDYFFAGDLIAFPGGHSVLWEQACASKTPCLFGNWPGIEHLNNGGNSTFLEDTSLESIKKTIQELKFTEKYQTMLEAARSEKTDIYRYSVIAQKSLEATR